VHLAHILLKDNPHFLLSLDPILTSPSYPFFSKRNSHPKIRVYCPYPLLYVHTHKRFLTYYDILYTLIAPVSCMCVVVMTSHCCPYSVHLILYDDGNDEDSFLLEWWESTGETNSLVCNTHIHRQTIPMQLMRCNSTLCC
jgi:hypothetical protein